MAANGRRKRAISLAGGGPAAGLHIGALQRLEEQGIDFDVWALSCIGAWVGIIYQQFDPPDRSGQTYRFFRDNIFRDDASYDRFPINRAFGPDLGAFAQAWAKFLAAPDSYTRHLVLPEELRRAVLSTFAFLSDPSRWMREGDRNQWFLNDVLAVHPMSRFLVSLAFQSEVNGFTRIYYPDSSFLESIRFDKLRTATADIYHNAWNLGTHSMQLFHNKREDAKYKRMSAKSLCACSALPYIEETVEIDGQVYCEGALVDTVSFKDLVEDYPDLDEVWVSRIADTRQVRPPSNIADGLANLCMLFAAEMGENDVKLFREKMRKRRHWKPRVIELPVSSSVDFRWNHENLDRGVAAGRDAVDRALASYR